MQLNLSSDQNNLASTEANVVANVARNFNEGTASEKQMMSILSFAPFTVDFDKRLDIFYSILRHGKQLIYPSSSSGGKSGPSYSENLVAFNYNNYV